MYDKDYFINLIDILSENNIKGRSSSLSHLKSAVYDWNIEMGWEKPNYNILSNEEKGFCFFSYTKREPRHCTLRHIFVLEKFRKQGCANIMMQDMIDDMQKKQIIRLRFFADLPSIKFYKSLGFKKWHGVSKTKLPFYYGDVYGNLLPLPKAQKRYVVSNNNNNKNINDIF